MIQLKFLKIFIIISYSFEKSCYTINSWISSYPSLSLESITTNHKILWLLSRDWDNHQIQEFSSNVKSSSIQKIKGSVKKTLAQADRLQRISDNPKEQNYSLQADFLNFSIKNSMKSENRVRNFSISEKTKNTIKQQSNIWLYQKQKTQNFSKIYFSQKLNLKEAIKNKKKKNQKVKKKQ